MKLGMATIASLVVVLLAGDKLVEAIPAKQKLIYGGHIFKVTAAENAIIPSSVEFQATDVTYKFSFDSNVLISDLRAGEETYSIVHGTDGTVTDVERTDSGEAARKLLDDRELDEDDKYTVGNGALHHRRLQTCDECEGVWDSLCSGTGGAYGVGSACTLVDYGSPFTVTAEAGSNVLCTTFGEACEMRTSDALCAELCSIDDDSTTPSTPSPISGPSPTPSPTPSPIPVLPTPTLSPSDCRASFEIVLDWDDEDVDLDLSVIEPDGEVVFWGDVFGDVGYLENLNHVGSGPETYFVRTDIPAEDAIGSYEVQVAHYSGNVPVTWTLKATLMGVILEDISETFNETFEVSARYTPQVDATYERPDCSIIIPATPAPTPSDCTSSFTIQLDWDVETDLDLAVVEPGGDEVIWYETSGSVGYLQNFDNVGSGPETYYVGTGFLTENVIGDYKATVSYWSGDLPVTWTLIATLMGEMVLSESGTFSASNIISVENEAKVDNSYEDPDCDITVPTPSVVPTPQPSSSEACNASVVFTLDRSNGGSDLDLYVVEPGGTLVYYYNQIGDVGFLNEDVTFGTAQEIYSTDTGLDIDVDPVLGEYKASVSFFSGEVGVTWTLTASSAGEDVWEETGVFSEVGDSTMNFTYTLDTYVDPGCLYSPKPTLFIAASRDGRKAGKGNSRM